MWSVYMSIRMRRTEGSRNDHSNEPILRKTRSPSSISDFRSRSLKESADAHKIQKNDPALPKIPPHCRPPLQYFDLEAEATSALSLQS